MTIPADAPIADHPMEAAEPVHGGAMTVPARRAGQLYWALVVVCAALTAVGYA